MRSRIFSLMILLLTIPLLAHSAYADSISLGNVAPFAVLAGSAVTNTGPTTIDGNVGLWPGPVSALIGTGLCPGANCLNLTGTIDATNGVAMNAQGDLTTLYTTLGGAKPLTADLTGKDLGGLTLTPGVYKFSSSAQLTGTLTLDAQNNPNAVWIFQIGSTLTTASGSEVSIINQASNANNGLFWQVGSSATLGTTTDFEGNIVALTSITMLTGATDDCGRILARNGSVTLDNNTIGIGCTGEDVSNESGSGGLSGGGSSEGGGGGGVAPEPDTLLLAGCGILALLALRRHS